MHHAITRKAASLMMMMVMVIDGDGDGDGDGGDDDDVMVMVMMITYTCIAQSLHSIVACLVRSGEKKKKMWKKSSIFL